MRAFGRGLFVMRSMLLGTGYAFVGGICCSFLGAFFGVGSLSFMIGSSFGFITGTLQHYQHSVLKATITMERYPALMLRYLDGNFPEHKWNKKRIEELKEPTKLGWVEEGMIVTAYQSLSSSVDVVPFQV